MDETYSILFKYTIFYILLSTRVTSQCIQKCLCSCKLPNGDFYDFSILAKEGPLELENGNVFFWFQPCKDVPLSNITVDDGCQSPFSLCTLNEDDLSRKGPVSLGTLSESKIESEPNDDQLLKLVYRHKETITNINLVCCDNCTTALKLNDPSTNSSITNLLLISPHLCKHKREAMISVTTVLLLMLGSLAFYLIGGALAFKAYNRIPDWEMSPNHEFCCALEKQCKNHSEDFQEKHGTPLAIDNMLPVNMPPIDEAVNEMSYESIKSQPRTIARLDITTNMSIDMSIKEQEKFEEAHNKSSNNCTDRKKSENSYEIKSKGKENCAPTTECDSSLKKPMFANNWSKTNKNSIYQQNFTLSVTSSQQSTFNSAHDTGPYTCSINNTVNNTESTSVIQKKLHWDEQLLSTEGGFSEWKENMKYMCNSTPLKFLKERNF